MLLDYFPWKCNVGYFRDNRSAVWAGITTINGIDNNFSAHSTETFEFYSAPMFKRQIMEIKGNVGG